MATEINPDGLHERTPVVLACDEGYAMPLATTLRSLAESNQRHWPLDVFLLADAFSEAARRKVAASLPAGAARLHWVQVDLGEYAGLATLPHISKATYARLLVPKVMPADVNRVLYLDADLLVLDDLSALWSVDLGDLPVGAVTDDMDALLQRGEPGWDDVPHVARYFNAGVLLMNLAAWRRERVSERALEFLAANPRTRMADQDALNVVCDGRWLSLPARWNVPCFQNENIGDLPAARRPGIAHFVTRRKPWVARYRSPHAAFYDSFRRRTCYGRTTGEWLRDEWVRFWAGCRNVLRRRGWLPPGDDWAPPKPVPRTEDGG